MVTPRLYDRNLSQGYNWANETFILGLKKNPAYRRHWITWHMQIVALMLNGWKMLTERKCDQLIILKFHVSFLILNIQILLFNSWRYLWADFFSLNTLLICFCFLFSLFSTLKPKSCLEKFSIHSRFWQNRSGNWLTRDGCDKF